MSQTARASVSLAILLAALLVLQLRSTGEAVPIGKPLDSFPATLGQWQGRRGWEPLEASLLTIALPAPYPPITVNHCLIQKDRDQQVASIRSRTRETSSDQRSMMLHALRARTISIMIQDQVVLLLLIGASVWLARWWIIDYRAALAGKPNDNPLPGATPASVGAVAIASLGALFLLAAETGGEYALGLSAGQSKMTALFGLYSILGAPVIEEVVFRGYLVIDNRGRAALWTGVVGASLLFALLHPFLWEWNAKGLTVHFGTQAWFSTAVVFAVSLWFYMVRFFGLNPLRSLLPCFIAHATKNLGVFAIKYVQGFVGGWW